MISGALPPEVLAQLDRIDRALLRLDAKFSAQHGEIERLHNSQQTVLQDSLRAQKEMAVLSFNLRDYGTLQDENRRLRDAMRSLSERLHDVLRRIHALGEALHA